MSKQAAGQRQGGGEPSIRRGRHHQCRRPAEKPGLLETRFWFAGHQQFCGQDRAAPPWQGCFAAIMGARKKQGWRLRITGGQRGGDYLNLGLGVFEQIGHFAVILLKCAVDKNAAADTMRRNCSICIK